MRYLIIPIFSETASFRNPEFQNFHKSFTLPPPTTIIGLAGAAMGLSPKASQDFFDIYNFRIGVCGKGKGMATDLWKYDTFSGRSIIKREIWFKNRFWVVFGTSNEEAFELIKRGFYYPKYALTIGTSDSLVRVDIKNIEIVEETILNTEISNALVEGDVVGDVLTNALKFGGNFIITTSDPVPYQLPVRFLYESDYGVRRTIKRKLFSFVGTSIKFENLKIEGVLTQNNVFIPIFDL